VRFVGSFTLPSNVSTSVKEHIMSGPLWSQMNARPRKRARDISGSDVPTAPGVYAWYRAGVPVYVGRAIGQEGLRGRVWKDHLQTGDDLSRSSFRRNVCEHLGVAPTSRTRLRPTVMTAADVVPVNEWISGCEVAWITCASDDEARALEDDIKMECRPLLTKR